MSLLEGGWGATLAMAGPRLEATHSFHVIDARQPWAPHRAESLGATPAHGICFRCALPPRRPVATRGDPWRPLATLGDPRPGVRGPTKSVCHLVSFSLQCRCRRQTDNCDGRMAALQRDQSFPNPVRMKVACLLSKTNIGVLVTLSQCTWRICLGGSNSVKT